jgi:hypothetical protein
VDAAMKNVRAAGLEDRRNGEGLGTLGLYELMP